MRTANCRFAITAWDEMPCSEEPGQPRLTRASVTRQFTGDLEGTGHVEYLMMYRADGTAVFVGLERVVGRLGGATGAFVFQRIGTFEGGQARESFSVVSGSGTEGLQGLAGDGTSSLGHGMEHPFTFSYELE